MDLDEIAELALQQFQEKQQQQKSLDIRGAATHSESVSCQVDEQPQPLLVAKTEDGELKGDASSEQSGAPQKTGAMSASQYRQRQRLGIQPEAPSYHDEVATKLAQRYPKLLSPSQAMDDDKEHQNEQQQQRREPLREPCQMPAIASGDSQAGGGGSQPRLVKTIEHYTFADGEDVVSIYVNFETDLWPGASNYISEPNVKVDCKASSLDVWLDSVPVSPQNLQHLAVWRLSLSPLFSRVEPSLLEVKFRSKKLTLRLTKVKAGPWKKVLKS
mmetsp:Transcript_89202/g.186422  ORF Transcript_89202/g.186422 Transcript_89202/m.186422 type:complete len:272 (+) Transcript_89202:97-912(+)